jgi:hypothetical protein
MKKILTLLFLTIPFFGFTQSIDYVKSNNVGNTGLFNNFKSYRDSLGCKIELVHDTLSSDIIFDKALWQSKGHFASHKQDPKNSWNRATDHALVIANRNSKIEWRSSCSGEITVIHPFRTTNNNNIKERLEDYINSPLYNRIVIEAFKGSPGHNYCIISGDNMIDTLYQTKNDFRRYVTISSAIDLKNPEIEKGVVFGKNLTRLDRWTYYILTTCIFTNIEDKNSYMKFPFTFNENGYEVTWLKLKNGYKTDKSGKIFNYKTGKRIRNLEKYKEKSLLYL